MYLVTFHPCIFFYMCKMYQQWINIFLTSYACRVALNVFIFCLRPRKGQALKSELWVFSPAAVSAAQSRTGEQVGSVGDVDRRKAREGRSVHWRIFDRPVTQRQDRTSANIHMLHSLSTSYLNTLTPWLLCHFISRYMSF